MLYNYKINTIINHTFLFEIYKMWLTFKVFQNKLGVSFLCLQTGCRKYDVSSVLKVNFYH